MGSASRPAHPPPLEAPGDDGLDVLLYGSGAVGQEGARLGADARPAAELKSIPGDTRRAPVGDPFSPLPFPHHPRHLAHLEPPSHPLKEPPDKILGLPPPPVDVFTRHPPAWRPPPPLLAVANPQ